MSVPAYAIVLTAFIGVLSYACAGEPVRVARTSLGIRPPPPELVRFMRQADQVFIFPNPTPRHPRRDAKRMRLLTPKARRDLIRVVGHHDHWFIGGGKGVGVRTGRKERGPGFCCWRGDIQNFFFSNKEKEKAQI